MLSGSAYTYKKKVELDYTLAPAIPTPPSRFVYGNNNQMLRVGVPITPMIPTYFGLIQSFVAQGQLPTGLSINPLTGVISGTPFETKDYSTLIGGISQFGVVTTGVSFTFDLTPVLAGSITLSNITSTTARLNFGAATTRGVPTSFNYRLVSAAGAVISGTVGGNASTTSLPVSGLSPNTVYTAYLTASNSVGTSNEIQSASAVLMPPTMVGITPTVASPISSSTFALLQFGNIAGASSFVITVNGGGSQTGILVGGGVFATGLQPNNSYTFAVQPASINGIVGDVSNTTSAIIMPPTMVGVVPTVASYTATSAVIEFAPVAGATLYTAVPSGNPPQTDLAYSNGGVTVTGLSPNTAYSFTVRAQNAFGSGNLSNASATITTLTV